MHEGGVKVVSGIEKWYKWVHIKNDIKFQISYLLDMMDGWVGGWGDLKLVYGTAEHSQKTLTYQAHEQ